MYKFNKILSIKYLFIIGAICFLLAYLFFSVGGVPISIIRILSLIGLIAIILGSIDLSKKIVRWIKGRKRRERKISVELKNILAVILTTLLGIFILSYVFSQYIRVKEHNLDVITQIRLCQSSRDCAKQVKKQYIFKYTLK